MTEQPLQRTAPPDIYRARRAKLAGALRRPIVLFAGRARARNYAAQTFPFRANSTYLYFGGPSLEGAAWIIEPNSNGSDGCTLLRYVPTLDDVVWTGEAPSDGAIAHAAGIPTSALREPGHLATLKGKDACAVIPICPTTMREAHDTGLQKPGEDELRAIIDLRLCKDAHELAAMRCAADIGVAAHLAAMRACQPGANEADVAAAWWHALIAHKSVPSFTPIISVRGEVLHSEQYVNPLRAGQLLLIDAGAEEPGGYASDITRTIPVSGTWSAIQRQIYDTVLAANRAAIAACTPGTRFRDVHDVAALKICEGLVTAGVLRGDPAQLAERRAHTLFFTHGVGHLIGLDVHDMEDFGDLPGYPAGRTRRTHFGDKFLRLDRDLTPGMATTIEPGIYFVPAIWQRTDWPQPFADCLNRPLIDRLIADGFGGIRVEDTVVIRDHGGPEVLTAALPADADALIAPPQH